MPRRYDEKRFDLGHLRATAERCKNWGRWGPDDEAGTLNFISPADVVAAGRLIRRGTLFSLGLNFDKNGPQKGLWGNRFNPIHTMLATGTDAIPGAARCARMKPPPLPVTHAVGSPINPMAIK